MRWKRNYYQLHIIRNCQQLGQIWENYACKRRIAALRLISRTNPDLEKRECREKKRSTCCCLATCSRSREACFLIASIHGAIDRLPVSAFEFVRVAEIERWDEHDWGLNMKNVGGDVSPYLEILTVLGLFEWRCRTIIWACWKNEKIMKEKNIQKQNTQISASSNVLIAGLVHGSRFNWFYRFRPFTN